MEKMNLKLLHGVIDTHIHTSPDAYMKRKYDDLQIAETAEKLKMRAVILKSHTLLTADRAILVQRLYPGVRVCGGIALNDSVGGLNVRAVDAALEVNAKIVWLPTVDAEYERRVLGRRGGIRCTDSNKVCPALDDILKLIAQKNCILATGHISKEEQRIVIERARELGVKKIIVNHPELRRIRWNIDEQRELLKFGVYFERCHSGSNKPASNEILDSINTNIAAVKALGPESTILASDLGQPHKTEWYIGMAEQITRFYSAGFSESQIQMMSSGNAAKLLDL